MSDAKIYVYTSSSGGTAVLHKTERAQQLIAGNGGKDRMEIVYLDIEADKRQFVWETSGKKGIYPLIFVGDEFVGEVEDIDEANEDERLKELLKIA